MSCSCGKCKDTWDVWKNHWQESYRKAAIKVYGSWENYEKAIFGQETFLNNIDKIIKIGE